MAFSVQTNASAFTALQTLTRTGQQLNTTQQRINTGLAVSSTRDDSAAFGIAQGLRGELSGINAARTSLDRATSTLDVAIAGAETVSDLLLRARELAAEASDAGLGTESRGVLADEFSAIRDQIDSVTAQAVFNGINLITSGTTDSIAALAGFRADGNTTINISVTAADLSASTLGLDTIFSTAATAATTLTEIDGAISTVDAALARFGAAFRQIETQRNFADVLSDTVETGIGNLVDADLARESANLQALQVRQQLGIQALGIANGQPQNILGLFR